MKQIKLLERDPSLEKNDLLLIIRFCRRKDKKKRKRRIRMVRMEAWPMFPSLLESSSIFPAQILLLPL